MVADNSSGFPLSDDMRHPDKMGALPVLLCRIAVLAVGECGIGHIHAIITHFLGFSDRIIMHSALPVPVCTVNRLYGSLIEFKPPVEAVRI